jgi:hypothetical protein
MKASYQWRKGMKHGGVAKANERNGINRHLENQRNISSSAKGIWQRRQRRKWRNVKIAANMAA